MSCYKICFVTEMLNKITNLVIKDIAKQTYCMEKKNKLLLRFGMNRQWTKIQKLVDKIEIDKKFSEILEPKKGFLKQEGNIYNLMHKKNKK